MLAALLPGAVQIAEATSHQNPCDFGAAFCKTIIVEPHGNGNGTVRTYTDSSYSTPSNRINCRREGGETSGMCSTLVHVGINNDPVTVYLGYMPDAGSCAVDPRPSATCYESMRQTGGTIDFGDNESITFNRIRFDVVNPRWVEVVRFGSGGGSVASSPLGISCGTKCAWEFASGSSVSLTATPNSQSIFTGWSGPCSGQGTTCVFTLNQNTAVVANFEPAATPTPSPTAPATPRPTPSPTIPVTSTPTSGAQPTQPPPPQPSGSPQPTESAVPVDAAPSATASASPQPPSAEPQLSPGAHLEPSHSPLAVGGLPPVLEQPAAAGTGALDLTPIFLAILLAGGLIGAGIFAGLRWGRRPGA